MLAVVLGAAACKAKEPASVQADPRTSSESDDVSAAAADVSAPEVVADGDFISLDVVVSHPEEQVSRLLALIEWWSGDQVELASLLNLVLASEVITDETARKVDLAQPIALSVRLGIDDEHPPVAGLIAGEWVVGTARLQPGADVSTELAALGGVRAQGEDTWSFTFDGVPTFARVEGAKLLIASPNQELARARKLADLQMAESGFRLRAQGPTVHDALMEVVAYDTAKTDEQRAFNSALEPMDKLELLVAMDVSGTSLRLRAPGQLAPVGRQRFGARLSKATRLAQRIPNRNLLTVQVSLPAGSIDEQSVLNFLAGALSKWGGRPPRDLVRDGAALMGHQSGDLILGVNLDRQQKMSMFMAFELDDGEQAAPALRSVMQSLQRAASSSGSGFLGIFGGEGAPMREFQIGRTTVHELLTPAPGAAVTPAAEKAFLTPNGKVRVLTFVDGKDAAIVFGGGAEAWARGFLARNAKSKKRLSDNPGLAAAWETEDGCHVCAAVDGKLLIDFLRMYGLLGDDTDLALEGTVGFGLGVGEKGASASLRIPSSLTHPDREVVDYTRRQLEPLLAEILAD